MGEIAEPCPAPFLLDRDAEKPERAELRPQLARKAVGAVDLGGVAARSCPGQRRRTVSRSISISLPRPKSRPGKLFAIIVRSSPARRGRVLASIAAGRPVSVPNGPYAARRRAPGAALDLSISAAGQAWRTGSPHLVTAGKPQQHPLFVGLDALRQHFHAKRVAERDDRLDDGAGRAGGAERSHKGAVDLELVERKFLQVAQARIAGAEIVERDADAQRAQSFEPLLRLLRVIDQDAFGHFEDDARRRDAGFGHDGADQIDQPAVANLHRRKIDRDRQGRPARAVGQRPPQHDLAKLGHQAALLGERNEHRRRIDAAARVVPAQQRFDADDGAAVGGDDRLIMDVESLQRDRRLQFAQQRTPLGIFGFDLRFETAPGLGLRV